MKFTLGVLFATAIALFPGVQSNYLALHAKTSFQPLVAIPDELDGTGRIVGGQAAKPGQFPWQVAIMDPFFCTGALICDSWVLTSALCLSVLGKIKTIYIGAYNLTQTDEPGRVVTESMLQIMHEKFNPHNFHNDVGLIQLKDKINFTDHIKPIPLGKDYIPGNVNLTLSGWGWNGVGDIKINSVLQYIAQVSMYSDECKHSYNRHHNMITNSTLCCREGRQDGPSAGDAADPLIHIGPNGKAVHVGIASFCHPEVGCGEGKPIGYVRTASYIDWIVKNIEGSCELPE